MGSKPVSLSPWRFPEEAPTAAVDDHRQREEEVGKSTSEPCQSDTRGFTVRKLQTANVDMERAYFLHMLESSCP